MAAPANWEGRIAITTGSPRIPTATGTGIKPVLSGQTMFTTFHFTGLPAPHPMSSCWTTNFKYQNPFFTTISATDHTCQHKERLSYRTESIAERTEFCRWECDLMMFRKAHGKVHVKSLVESSSR
nr:hypothetical protein [Loktanella sp. M215]